MNVRDTIQESDDTEVKIEVVPEWKHVKIELRGLSVAEVGAIADKQRKNPENGVAYGIVRWLIGGVFDPDTGQRAFTEDDAAWLVEKSTKVAQRVSSIIQKLSGQAEEGLEDAVLRFIDLTDGEGSDADIRTAYADMRRIARGDNVHGVLGEGPDGSSATTSIEPSTLLPEN